MSLRNIRVHNLSCTANLENTKVTSKVENSKSLPRTTKGKKRKEKQEADCASSSATSSALQCRKLIHSRKLLKLD